eukprot:TRINITY_DN10463_c0_g1_i1.p1 TRINITY_DN10463_c0_g1~~TRINITY_DN10463_c0_g1_i1.p1  ORF type:complete len:124 (+),score=14.15 TRINITY_DN10463_c0_g1_i1:66-437(+)
MTKYISYTEETLKTLLESSPEITMGEYVGKSKTNKRLLFNGTRVRILIDNVRIFHRNNNNGMWTLGMSISESMSNLFTILTDIVKTSLDRDNVIEISRESTALDQDYIINVRTTVFKIWINVL